VAGGISKYQTSTNKPDSKPMHRSGRSSAIGFRDFFGGHSVMVAVELNGFARWMLSCEYHVSLMHS
jgi:hypothetical protein